MINFKQLELSHVIFDKLKQRFPELELVNIIESPESPFSVWVNVIMPDDEDRELEVRQMASELSADIHMDYGYHILVLSSSREEKLAA